jgi:cytochrome P450/NADPH-cytochrome P450 reductase
MLTYMLTQKPECQEKIREELDSIIPDTESMTAANLGKLKYTSAVIKEGLRLHPIVGTISVVSVEDTVLADVQIPKGSPM